MHHENPTTGRRRGRTATALLVVILTTLLTVAIAPQVGAAPTAQRSQAPRLTASQTAVKNALNRDRHLRGLRVLTTQADAQAKAQAWAERLASEGRIYHSNLRDGIRTGWCSLGENVGYGPSARSIEAGYMSSPTHRANILSSKWTGVGVGYAVRGNTVYTVQFFIKTC